MQMLEMNKKLACVQNISNSRVRSAVSAVSPAGAGATRAGGVLRGAVHATCACAHKRHIFISLFIKNSRKLRYRECTCNVALYDEGDNWKRDDARATFASMQSNILLSYV